MARCKDCVHVEVCCSYLSTAYNKCKLATPDFKLLKNIECDECQHFKDRAHFVELPCKVGDFVYYIKARRVMADIVSKFTIDRCGVMLQRVNGYNLGYTDQLGKKIFLTREEAEQALKEREENAN